jgi:outer membrane protein assembly factor BamB
MSSLTTLPAALRTIAFNYPIAQHLEKDGRVIIRFDIIPPTKNNENIICVDSSSGNQIWQIAKIATVYADSPYTSMAFKGDELWLSNWDGSNVHVDLLTGTILAIKQGK